MAPAHLQFPPKGAIALTPIPETVPLTPGIHPGLGGPDPATVPQRVPVPPAHPDVESGLPVVADQDMVSHAVQFAEGPSNPPIGLAEELALMREALQEAEEALAAECDQFQAATEALTIERCHLQHTKQAYEEELQVAQAALVEEQKQLNSVKQAFQGELETARDQLCSTNHSYKINWLALVSPVPKMNKMPKSCNDKGMSTKKDWKGPRKQCPPWRAQISHTGKPSRLIRNSWRRQTMLPSKLRKMPKLLRLLWLGQKAAHPVPAPCKSPLKFQFVKCEVKPEGLVASTEVTGSSAPTPKPHSSRGYKGPTSVTSCPSFHVQGVDEFRPSLGACAHPMEMKPVGTQTQPEYKLPPEHDVQPRGSSVAKYQGRVVPSEVPDPNGGLVTPRGRSNRHVTSGSEV